MLQLSHQVTLCDIIGGRIYVFYTYTASFRGTMVIPFDYYRASARKNEQVYDWYNYRAYFGNVIYAVIILSKNNGCVATIIFYIKVINCQQLILFLL